MQSSSSGKWWSAARPYRHALLILIGSRLVLFSAVLFSVRFLPPSAMAQGEGALSWYQYLVRWDAGWYLQIAREGYSFNGDDYTQQPVVFEPLYPLVSKAIALMLGIPDGAALVLVSNLLILIAALLIFKLISDDYGEVVALYALSALCFFPTALFFSVGYTESLALLLIAAFFLALNRGRFLTAALFAGLAMATRVTSVVLLLPLLWELWRAFSKEVGRMVRVGFMCVAIATSGLWLYMIYLWVAFNRPLAVITNHRAWNGSGSWGELFRVITLQPFLHLGDVWRDGPIPETLAPWFYLLFVILLISFRKKLPASYTLYTLGLLLMPYLISGGNEGFRSFNRYVLLAFPVFLIMGEIFSRRLWLGLAVIALFAALLFMHAALYAQAYWAG